jgi:hypothetical protein
LLLLLLITLLRLFVLLIRLEYAGSCDTDAFDIICLLVARQKQLQAWDKQPVWADNEQQLLVAVCWTKGHPSSSAKELKPNTLSPPLDPFGVLILDAALF